MLNRHCAFPVLNAINSATHSSVMLPSIAMEWFIENAASGSITLQPAPAVALLNECIGLYATVWKFAAGLVNRSRLVTTDLCGGSPRRELTDHQRSCPDPACRKYRSRKQCARRQRRHPPIRSLLGRTPVPFERPTEIRECVYLASR
jgi:hypothetical protein